MPDPRTFGSTDVAYWNDMKAENEKLRKENEDLKSSNGSLWAENEKLKKRCSETWTDKDEAERLYREALSLRIVLGHELGVVQRRLGRARKAYREKLAWYKKEWEAWNRQINEAASLPGELKTATEKAAALEHSLWRVKSQLVQHEKLAITPMFVCEALAIVNAVLADYSAKVQPHYDFAEATASAQEHLHAEQIKLDERVRKLEKAATTHESFTEEDCKHPPRDYLSWETEPERAWTLAEIKKAACIFPDSCCPTVGQQHWHSMAEKLEALPKGEKP